MSEIAPNLSAAPDIRAVDRMAPWFDRHRRWFFAAIVVLYLAALNGQWRIEPDGALYLSLGRNLAEGRGYTYHERPHHLAYPGLPYLIAGTFKIFGDGNLWPVHIIVLGCALATLALTYALIQRVADRPTAVIVTILLATTFQFYSYAYQLRNDMPFVLGVMMFLLGFERIWSGSFSVGEKVEVRGVGNASNSPDALSSRLKGSERIVSWTLLIIGLFLAIVMRPAMWALIPAVLGAVAWSGLRRRRSRGLFIVFALLAIAIFAFWLLDPRRSGSPHFSGDYEVEIVNQMGGGLNETFARIFRRNVPMFFGPIVAETMLGHEIGPVINPLVGIAIIALGVALVRRRVIWGLWIACTVLMMLVVLPTNAILPRYLLPVLPFLVYAMWIGLVWLNKRLRRPWDWLFVILFAILLTVNGFKIGDLIREQRRSPFLESYRHGRYEPMMELAEAIRQNVPPGAIVLTERKYGRLLSYLSHRRVTESVEIPNALKPTANVYVIEPMDEDAIDLLERSGLSPRGATLASVPQKNVADAPNLVLRRAIDARLAPPATTQPNLLGDASR